VQRHRQANDDSQREQRREADRPRRRVIRQQENGIWEPSAGLIMELQTERRRRLARRRVQRHRQANDESQREQRREADRRRRRVIRQQENDVRQHINPLIEHVIAIFL
jgi:hypothetical protein